MKLKQKKSSRLVLSDKIADALTVKARADIEDDQVFDTKPKTVSRVDLNSSDSEDEAAISDFRKRNINLLSDISKKYDGQVVSRKELAGSEDGSYEESDTEDESNLLTAKDLSLDDIEESADESADDTNKENELPSDEEESDDYGINQFKKQIQGSDDYSYDNENDSDNDGGSDDENEEEGYDISQLDEPMKEEFEHVKKQNISEEVKKGTSVRNQLLLWEGLLEMRIHLQRCMNMANQLPLPDTYLELKENNDFTEECSAAKANVATVLDKFLNLQNMLYKNFPETKNLSTKKQSTETEPNKKEESDEEIPSDTDNEEIPSDTEGEEEEKQEVKSPKCSVKPSSTRKRKLEEYGKELAMSHKAFKSFRDSTIQKWNDKTRLATAANIKNTPTNTILQQISYILSDREKLIKRTQLKRSEYDIIGYKKAEDVEENGDANPMTKGRKENDEYISEIFDDSDFYHQLLRELIECKSADISDPVQLSRQWIALQQMRSKMKRKVDTKATKGRKIKYVVHNQLVNYMAPEKCTTWTDESRNELYSSLFGKMFEHNNIGLNANVENGFKLKD
ncbi:protein AATF [Hyposmocoma kahamanoa]|uniref:protein AATF n=1 Tax=Hyposmocoma kahamanoa TaxID=1477025 RepID=UPI000E6D5F28|nr:protein AATF [Hyposmocoma kahamanoa]